MSSVGNPRPARLTSPVQPLSVGWDCAGNRAVARAAPLGKTGIDDCFSGRLFSSCLVFCFFVFDRYTEHKYRSIAYACGMLWHHCGGM